ncbi:MAG TPA: lactonase family protein [Gemmataceae bacterium]|nr:lactonase family protein [Gemmataceae bacterium]
MAISHGSAACWFALAFSLCIPAAALAESAVAAPTPKTYWVYIGTYTGKDSSSKGIYRFDLDAATGRLSNKTLAAESASPSYLAVAPSGKFLYSVNEVPGGKFGAISAFALDPKTGGLTFLNQQSSVGSGPCHLIVDKEGKHVLAANYGSGSTIVLPIDEKGSIRDYATDFVQHTGKSVDPARQEGPHAHCVALDAANRFAFVCDLGLDKVLVYKYDAEKGKITPNEPPAADLAPGSGPRHIAFTPDYKYAYVVNELNLTITGFRYDADHGSLKEIQTQSTLPKGTPPSDKYSCAEVVVHPSGKFVYATNRGQDTIATFAIDAKTGELTPVGWQGDGIKVPRGFNVDPSGTWAVAANQDGDSIVVFAIDPKTGELKTTGVKADVGKPVDVRIIPKPEG